MARSHASGAMPTPVSATATSTPPLGRDRLRKRAVPMMHGGFRPTGRPWIRTEVKRDPVATISFQGHHLLFSY